MLASAASGNYEGMPSSHFRPGHSFDQLGQQLVLVDGDPSPQQWPGPAITRAGAMPTRNTLSPNFETAVPSLPMNQKSARVPQPARKYELKRIFNERHTLLSPQRGLIARMCALPGLAQAFGVSHRLCIRYYSRPRAGSHTLASKGVM